MENSAVSTKPKGELVWSNADFSVCFADNKELKNKNKYAVHINAKKGFQFHLLLEQNLLQKINSE